MTAGNSILVDGLVVDHRAGADTVRALDCRALSVGSGVSVAVTGRSGSGKSTLIGVLAGLTVPTAGSVTIGETEITTLSESARTAFRKSAIGVVYQTDNLLPFLTVTENVLLQLSLSAAGASSTDPAEAATRVQELLTLLGLGDLGDRLPDELSGGQRQRAAVARAVVHRPSLVLADEPTGALDEANARSVIELLAQLQQDLGATLVVVTHDPMVAARMQRIVHLEDGSIIERNGVVS